METSPPEGYKLPDSVKEYYFYFSNTEDTAHTLPTDIPSDAVDLSNEARTVYVENVKNTTEVTVEKKWQDKDGNPIEHNNGSVTINLYQKISQGGSSGSGGGETGGEGSEGSGVSYSAKCNSSTMSGTFDNVNIGDTVKISVNYTWQASSYKVAPSEWTGVSEGAGEYSNNGYTYDYTCKISGNPITFTTGDQEGSIQSITCTCIRSEESEASGTDVQTPDILEVYKSTTIDSSMHWKYTFTNLPLTGTDNDGKPVTYYYYIEEVSVPNYDTSYENNNGIQSGTITVTNKATDTPSYQLPETGGPGTRIAYTLGSILMMFASAAFLYIKKKRMGKKGGLK